MKKQRMKFNGLPKLMSAVLMLVMLLILSSCQQQEENYGESIRLKITDISKRM